MYEAARLMTSISIHFITLPFMNKRIDLYDIPHGSSISNDKSETLSIPDYFQKCEPSIFCYKYNKSIRNPIFIVTEVSQKTV